ncbi:MAG: DUF1559 domain-containing protein [Planctomycetaceae bacterium]|jgi:prepilin-type processing-associated H-X9-DG protein|nr:DUF1559 domain-containing protein [Planctomycetaceae bacterium]
MRHLPYLAVLTAVFLAVLTVFRVSAQETFAPLITENTIAFVHIDLRKVEVDTLKAGVEEFGEELLRKLNFDEESFTMTIHELKADLEKFDAAVRPPFSIITNVLGIREIAVIADSNLSEFGIAAVLVAPWKNQGLPDKDNDLKITNLNLKNLLSFVHLDNLGIEFIASGDFLFIPIPVNGLMYNKDGRKEATRFAVTEWAINAVPAKESLIQQALKTLGTDEIKVAAALNKKLKEQIRSLPLPNSMPQDVQELLMSASQKIEWAAASLSLDSLFRAAQSSNGKGASNDKSSPVRLLTIKTAANSEANALRSSLANVIVHRISDAREQQANNSSPHLSPLFFEFLKGILLTFLPGVEDDRLVFRTADGDITLPVIASAGVFIPYFQAVHKVTFPAAQGIEQCQTNLKTIVLAFHNYHDSYNALPPLYTVDAGGKPLHSWRVLILPFLERSALYQKIRLNEPWDSDYNKQFHNADVPLYRCPNGPHRAGDCCYSVIAGEGLVPAKKAGEIRGESFARIADGTSNTLAVVEVKKPFCWMDPAADITLDELSKGINVGRAGSYHPNGINAALFDGSVRFIANDVAKKILKALGTCNGGEAVVH